MKFDVKEISPIKKSIKVEIPEEIVSREIAQAYSSLNKKVLIPGFRKGRAPLPVLEKRYGASVEEDVIRKLVPDYYQKAIKEAGLRPVELPAIEKVELKKDAPLLFTANVEISPSVNLENYTGLKITPQKVEVTNLDVDRALEILQEQHGELKPCPETHSIVEKDFVVIDFEGRVEGNSLDGGTAKNQTLEIGSKKFIPGFEEQLINHRKGETVHIKTHFPADYPKKELAGKAVEFEVQIREVRQKSLPSLDDEFAKDVGAFENLAQLKEKLQVDIGERMKKESEQGVRRDVMKQLVEGHRFDVPGSLVEREVEESVHRLQQRLPKGVSLEQANMDPGKLRQEIEPAARDKVKGRFILQAIADQEKILMEKEDIDKAMEETAKELKMSADDVRRMILSQDGSIEVFKARLTEDKALDWVVSKAEIDRKN